VFGSLFHLKNFGFWPIILQNGTKQHAKFLTKRYSFSILDFDLKRQKKKSKSLHSPHEKFSILDGTKHTMKILTFCISSFQSSWHFAFCIPRETKHSLSHEDSFINPLIITFLLSQLEVCRLQSGCLGKIFLEQQGATLSTILCMAALARKDTMQI
jgi:hypothetical protein